MTHSRLGNYHRKRARLWRRAYPLPHPMALFGPAVPRSRPLTVEDLRGAANIIARGALPWCDL